MALWVEQLWLIGGGTFDLVGGAFIAWWGASGWMVKWVTFTDTIF